MAYSVGNAESVALLQKIFDCFNSHDPEKFRAFCSDDFEFHDASSPHPIKGRETFLTLLQGWWSAFPDATIIGKMTVAFGNWAAAEATAKGTHKGIFKGIPATGKVVSWPLMEIAEFRDGRLKTLRAYRDNANIYKQLGVLPVGL